MAMESQTFFSAENRVAPLGIVPLAGARELSEKVEAHLVRWAKRAGMDVDTFIIENSCPFEAALLPKKGFKLIQIGMTHHIPAAQRQGVVSHFDRYLINCKGHFNPLTLERIQGQLAVMSVGKGKIRRMP